MSAVRTRVFSVLFRLLYYTLFSLFCPFVAEQSGKSGSIRPSRLSEPEFEQVVGEGEGSQPQATSDKRQARGGGRLGSTNNSNINNISNGSTIVGVADSSPSALLLLPAAPSE